MRIATRAKFGFLSCILSCSFIPVLLADDCIPLESRYFALNTLQSRDLNYKLNCFNALYWHSVSEHCQAPHAHEIPEQAFTTQLQKHRHWVRSDAYDCENTSHRANFCNADLRGYSLADSILSFANLMGANLENVTLTQSRLRGVNLRNSLLASADFEEAELECADLSEAFLWATRFSGSDLAYSNLSRTYLFRADFEEADLTSASLSHAHMENADLTNAILHGANLTGATLLDADLSGARLVGTRIEGAKISRVRLNHARYEAVSVPALGYIDNIVGLSTVTFKPGAESGLVQLREQLRKSGRRHLEREATFALEKIRTRHLLEDRSWIDKLHGVFRLILFEWPVAWGLQPGRALLLVMGLWLGLSIVYAMAILQYNGRSVDTGPILWLVQPTEMEGRALSSTMTVALREGSPVGNVLRSIGWGIYFSLLSTVQLGWRDINVASWLSQAQPSEFVLKSRGWVRILSGAQSIISVYLVAIWALSYFARPFH